MSWRVINVSNEARLSLALENLVVRQEEEYRIPLEDIGALILESRSIVLTSALLDACAQHKIALFCCDEKHLPSAVLLGYQQHSRQGKVIEHQLSWSEPFKKRVWQHIVRQKILNQKQVAEWFTGVQHPEFDDFARSVQSGDPLNREATAARRYFELILPAGSSRQSDDRTNAALNYGYAIVRGTLARSIAAYGFLASVGIAHKSELNNFNLADDLIEPFRPVVDLVALELIRGSNEGVLEKEDRLGLAGSLTKDVLLDGREQSVIRAGELMVQSLVTATEEKDPSAIKLPVVII